MTFYLLLNSVIFTATVAGAKNKMKKYLDDSKSLKTALARAIANDIQIPSNMNCKSNSKAVASAKNAAAEIQKTLSNLAPVKGLNMQDSFEENLAPGNIISICTNFDNISH